MAAQFVDLKYTKAEQKAEAKEISPTGQPTQYPWGLCIRLESEELGKLGFKDHLPEVGGEIHFAAVAKVTSVNRSASEGQDDETCVALQITMMQVLSVESAASERSEKEAPESEGQEPASVMSYYKGKR